MSLQEIPPLIVAPKISVDIDEACDLTGFSLREISQGINLRTLRAYRIQGKCVILIEDLVAFIRLKPQYIDTLPEEVTKP
jgi:hypothetical protein